MTTPHPCTLAASARKAAPCWGAGSLMVYGIGGRARIAEPTTASSGMHGWAGRGGELQRGGVASRDVSARSGSRQAEYLLRTSLQITVDDEGVRIRSAALLVKSPWCNDE